MSAEAELLLLGGVEAWDGATRISLARRERALLARLALDVGRVVSMDRLIDDLWGVDPPAGARNTVQVYVSHLRRRLGTEVIDSAGGGYRLTLPPESVDAHRFAGLVASGAGLVAAGQLGDAASTFGRALALWRGEPLADLADYEFARVEATRLAELRAGAVEDLAEMELAGGRHDRVVAEYGPFVRVFPFRERLRAAVMTGLYRQGRAADALEVFRDAQALFREELGLDPGPGLQALQAAILADDPALVTAAPGARREIGAVPAPATPLLGRAVEAASVAALLDQAGVRLVTMLGAGGTGKTRLALEIANDPPPRFAGTTIWVSLVALDDPILVLSAVGSALRVQAPQIDVVQVASAVEGGPALLVLDNAEHLLPDVAGVVADLLAGCPQLSVLVTSRMALHLTGEHRYPLGALAVPGTGADLDVGALLGNPAVALFAARAAQVRPGFTVNTGNAAPVAAICRRLDGLPLALELAAARAGLLEPAAMLARLESRLGLLTAGQVAAGDRHRSLRATLDWSYRLLTPAAAWLFTTLGVFRGGFALGAAEKIATETLQAGSTSDIGQTGEGVGEQVLGAFAELLDASFIGVDPGSANRLVMLETILEYAGEKLGQSGQQQALRDAHCAYFREAVNRRWPTAPLRPRTAAEADWYLAEQDNLRTATQWAVHRGDRVSLADLATGTAGHWSSTGQWPGAEQWLQQVADDPDSGIRRCDAERWLAINLTERASLQDALRHSDRAVRLLHESPGDPGRLALTLSMRSLLRHFAGRDRQAARDAEAAVAAAEATNNLDERATALAGAYFNDPETARTMLVLARETAAAAGNEHALHAAFINLAELALEAGDGDTALLWCNEAQRLEISSRQPMDAAWVLSIMAGAMLVSGDLIRARPTLREAVRLAARAGHTQLFAETTLFWAALVAASGDPGLAAVLLGSHEQAMRALGRQRVDSSVTVYERFLANLNQRLNPDEFQARLRQGARLSTDQLLDWLVNDHPPSLHENAQHHAPTR